VLFIDSNVTMYVVGNDSEYRVRAERLCDQLVLSGKRLVTSAEVYQEIWHRYRAINREATITHGFAHLDVLVDEVYPIERSDVRRAYAVVNVQRNMDARGALHVAVMERYGIMQIASFEHGFDQVRGLERLS
jgi:uncharacterized protein